MAPSKLREYFKVEYQPGERVLVQKVDFFILTFCCLSYFMNYVSPHHCDLTSTPVPSPTDVLAHDSSTAQTWPMPTFRA